MRNNLSGGRTTFTIKSTISSTCLAPALIASTAATSIPNAAGSKFKTAISLSTNGFTQAHRGLVAYPNKRMRLIVFKHSPVKTG
jgi:hypothetical protein